MGFTNSADINLQAEIVIRLMLAFILSAAIGVEREQAQRPAGLRTHILVGMGACGYMLISIFGFDNLGTVRDPARVAAQIITGIGFLGAGTIWRNDTRVGGLTTAASIWVVAAIGMMAGTGMWFAAMFLTLLSWFTLHVVKAVDPHLPARLTWRRSRRYGERAILVEEEEGNGEDELIS